MGARDALGRLKRLAGAGDVRPGSREAANIVWVFGTIRTGSTWLASMMGDLEGWDMWNEPRVGELFGDFFYGKASHRRENRNFIMSDAHRDVWLKAMRHMILDSAAARYPDFAKGKTRLVIKEPSGSIGAPLLAEALPESRMILLVRDPRDMVASALDAARKDSWASRLKGRKKRLEEKRIEEPAEDSEERMNQLARQRAKLYLRAVGNSKTAYESHEGPKVLVRYEDLLADTPGEAERIYSSLGIKVDREDLGQVMKRHAWESIPDEEKGPGKFTRKASPGGWREDLTPEQARMVEKITAPLLAEFYPEERT